MTGLSRSTIYAMIARREFPAQIRISKRCVGWNSCEVNAWIKEKITETNPLGIADPVFKKPEHRCNDALNHR